MTSTTEQTEKYIEEHPSIKDCLKNNIINYSKLSRKIATELKIEKKTSMEAILIACRRYEAKLKNKNTLEKNIINILQNSELEIKNKILVTVIDKKNYTSNFNEIEKKTRQNQDSFYFIEGTKVFTIITSEKYLQDLKKLFNKNIKKISRNLALITLKHPTDMETTPGVVSFLYSIFAEHGINIVETMSCWTDTIFIISEEDIPRIMKHLKF